MKKYIAIIVLIIVAVGCSTSKKNNRQTVEITQFEYKAYTRGSNKEVVVTHDKIKVKELRLGKSIEAAYPLSKNNWDKFVTLTQKVNLTQLATLEAPSKKHQFDGAMAATLTIIVADQIYNSVTFDDGNPPAEIKALVEEIIGISGVGKIQVKE